MKYLVEYDWELPGWDEFGKQVTGEQCMIAADSEEKVEQALKLRYPEIRLFIYNIKLIK